MENEDAKGYDVHLNSVDEREPVTKKRRGEVVAAFIENKQGAIRY